MIKIIFNIPDLIKLYNEEKSVEFIAKKYKVCRNTISKNLKENGVILRKAGWKYEKYNYLGGKYTKKYSCNENYFSKPNIENCYWAGFIAADGNITEDNSIRIMLGIKDIKHLELFKTRIKYTGSIKIYIDKNGLKYCRLEIFNKKIINDLLKNFNITPRKTFTLEPPSLKNKNYIKSFIVGYIDGDGSTFYSNNIFSLSILGTESMMIWIKKYLLLFSKETTKSKIYKTKNTYVISFSNTKAEKIYQTFLNIKNDKLERKWKYNLPLKVNN